MKAPEDFRNFLNKFKPIIAKSMQFSSFQEKPPKSRGISVKSSPVFFLRGGNQLGGEPTVARSPAEMRAAA
jgi:hypothetical protein